MLYFMNLLIHQSMSQIRLKPLLSAQVLAFLFSVLLFLQHCPERCL
nr:MAG TPA: hypothetical protein [Caudoviricetes sp.]